MTKEDVRVTEMDLVFFDTETTGLELSNELIEIGLVKVRRGTYEVVAEESIKIKPLHPERSNPEALRINGYTDAGWADAVDLKTGLTRFLTYTAGCMLVGHNLAFDWMHLKKSLEQCGLTANYYYKGLDTFSLAWQQLRSDPKFKRFSLSELAPHFGVNQGTAHRALDDARTTYGIFIKLAEL